MSIAFELNKCYNYLYSFFFNNIDFSFKLRDNLTGSTDFPLACRVFFPELCRRRSRSFPLHE